MLNFCIQVDSIKTDNVSLTNFQQILARKASPNSNFNKFLNDFQITCYRLMRNMRQIDKYNLSQEKV